VTGPHPLIQPIRSIIAAGLIAVLAAGLIPPPRSLAVNDPDPAAAAARTMRPATDPTPPEITRGQPAGSADPVDPADQGPSGPGTMPDQQPSIIYDEAMDHEHDHIAFVPGGRVTVGFKPRPDDQWPVGGHAPSALPAGRATGREMAASPQGSSWAPIDAPGKQPTDAPATAPIDAPGGESAMGTASAVTSAVTVGYTEPAVEPVLDPAAASGLRRQVFGFLPYWEVPGASTKLNYDVLSTIAYFSVGATRSGNLKKRTKDGSKTTGWAGWTSAEMTSVINHAHKHGTRVVLTASVFAWTSSQASVQRALLGSSSARLNLARQLAAAVRDRGADGVNLDFEPLASGYESEFIALLKTLRAELNKVRSGYQVTYDTTGYIGNYPIEASVGSRAADAIFVMGYDYRTSSSSTAGSIDPLSGPKYDLADTVRSYTARVSPSRVILGIPWYGRAWSTKSDAVRSKNISGAKYGYSTAVNYETLVGLVAKYGRRWDSVEQSPYFAYRRENCTSTYGCVTGWRQVYYDDAASMRRRYALVNDYGLRGAGIWALGYDGGHAELYRALSVSFLVDKTAPQAGIEMLPTTTVDEGFVVSWAASDTSAIASYDVQASVDGGGWTTWLSDTRKTSDVWLGADGHGYAFRVRATDSKGNAGRWNTTSRWSSSPSLEVGGFGRVRADGLSYRAGPDTSAALLGKLSKGTILAVTRGPVQSDGYTWWEVTQPIREWGPVSFVERGVWIAGSSSSSTYVTAYRAPNSTTVDAGLRGLDFGSGSTSAVGTGKAARAARRFSPNGDGSGDTLTLRWTNTLAMDSITLKVYRSSGALVGTRTVTATGKGAQTWSWNGRAGGSVVAEGTYLLQLVGSAGARTYTAPSSRAVTSSQIASYAVVVDTTPPTVTSIGSNITVLSPNGDGSRDQVRLTLSARGASRCLVRLANEAGSVVRTVTGSGGSIDYLWPGTDDHGRTVPDGRYVATLLAYDAAGNPAGGTRSLRVDTTPPVIKLHLSRPVFSPNGDRSGDRTALAWSADEKVWGRVRILKGSTVVRSWKVRKATVGSVTWDGRDAAGRRVADGRYTFQVKARDVGRSWTTVSTRVVVDRTASFLRWSHSFYPQDGDALRQTSRLKWRLSRTATTTLRLFDDEGHLVRTAWKDRSQRAGKHGWTWNGRLADGSDVPVGRYQARLTVTSKLGSVELRRQVWVAPYIVSLSATTVRPGQTLTVRFRTVEPLASRPKVVLRQPGLTAVKVTATRLSSTRYRARFVIRSGPTGAAEIRIRARDAGGHRNRMAIPIRVTS